MTLHTWILSSRSRYIRRVQKLRRVTQRLSARQVAVFVLCTPQQPYERALLQWRHWMETGKMKGSLANKRRGYVDALPSTGLRRRRGEGVGAWVKRLERLAGFGPAKAPFLASLLEPTTRDVPVCLDVWMLRGLHGQDDGDGRWGGAMLVRATQELCVWQARFYNMPRFAWQWAAWDYYRTRQSVAQGVLTVNETDIGRDLG